MADDIEHAARHYVASSAMQHADWREAALSAIPAMIHDRSLVTISLAGSRRPRGSWKGYRSVPE
jgi:hypothetical protein